MSFDTKNLLLSNQKLLDAFENALAMTKKAINDVDGWQTLKGSTTFKGHDEQIFAWKKEIPGMTVPMWKTKTLLHKPPEHFRDVYIMKYSDVLKSEHVPCTDARILVTLSPDIRVVYQRHKCGGLISARDSVFVQGVHKEGEKYYFVDVSVPKALPKRKHTLRIEWFLISGVLYVSPDDPKKTVLHYVAQKDLGGLLPKRLYNSSATHRICIPFWRKLEQVVVTDEDRNGYLRSISKSASTSTSTTSTSRDSFASIEGSFSIDGDNTPSPSTSQRSLSISTEPSEVDTKLIKFLTDLDLKNYIETFQKEEVTYRMLLEMDEKDLQDMGIPFGPRRAIAKAKKSNTLESSVTTINNIEISGKIGGGNFGEVYEGVWDSTTPVALKKLHEKSQMDEFVKEASLLQNMVHPNILRFYGIFNNNSESFIVTELLPMGNLRDFLRKRVDDISVGDLVQMAKDVAAGLTYMKSHKVIHRDLSARNLLVAEQEGRFSVKISDFGLSRTVENDYYTLSDASKYPIKWTAPEVYDTKRHSIESDIWSFGVVLWEMFSYGAEPYAGMTNKEVTEYVKNGNRLECPEACPSVIFEELILPCWNEASKRPSLQHIFRILSDLETTFVVTTRKGTLVGERDTALSYQNI